MIIRKIFVISSLKTAIRENENNQYVNQKLKDLINQNPRTKCINFHQLFQILKFFDLC